jgi:hypothetical protein
MVAISDELCCPFDAVIQADINFWRAFRHRRQPRSASGHTLRPLFDFKDRDAIRLFFSREVNNELCVLLRGMRDFAYD